MKRLWCWMALALAIALGAIAWCAGRNRVPAYQGKDVYEWMLETRSSALESNPGLLAIGSNAVPFLAKALGTEQTQYDRYPWVRTSWFQNLARSFHLGATWTRPATELRRSAAWSLLAFGFEARAALPQLHHALVKPGNPDRSLVIYTLSALGCPPESLPWLMKGWPVATNDLNGSQDAILYLFEQAGSNVAPVAMPLVLDSLTSTRVDIRGRAAEVLSRWAQPAPEAIPDLLVMLKSTNDYARVSAASALGCITNRCDDAVPHVRALLESTNDRARAVAAMTLWRLGGDPEDSRQRLEGLLRSHGGKAAAARYLAEMGPLARASVPALLKAIDEPAGRWVEGYDRAQCARAVLLIAGHSPPAYKALEEAITVEDNSWVRTTMCGQIPQLVDLARPLLPALGKASADPDRYVRHEAARALQKLKDKGYE